MKTLLAVLPFQPDLSKRVWAELTKQLLLMQPGMSRHKVQHLMAKGGDLMLRPFRLTGKARWLAALPRMQVWEELRTEACGGGFQEDATAASQAPAGLREPHRLPGDVGCAGREAGSSSDAAPPALACHDAPHVFCAVCRTQVGKNRPAFAVQAVAAKTWCSTCKRSIPVAGWICTVCHRPWHLCRGNARRKKVHSR